ncbi:Pyruvate/Phosphoenolpyruvate kinase [Penicillium maclennaniae]|uniref:Pyruvate/Phosphoenolpyruvate kinase n=1 Tax=Penicillium maclennaniae TaxID=1343394 RepID=UPI002541AA0B|nr:Pyruvate/Phosphoenolpyruvate kinase [Penicillium maclennaniae]KAJ5661833.1 Pyruvate/Phosphoenolpyruvate kinase [Penicillium maclennaniae]
MNTQNEIAQHLISLHNPGNRIILPNAYDAATATIIASLPTAHAVATASFAIAATLGVKNSALTKIKNISALKSIASAVHAVNCTKPITVDLQDDYGSVAELSATIPEVIHLGAVGCNLEDLDSGTGALRTLEDAVERVRAVVKAAAEASILDRVVNARTDVLCQDGMGIPDAVAGGRAFLEAGACTVFVWGGPWGRGIYSNEGRELVRALLGMVNVKMSLNSFLDVQQLRDLSVARISVGPELWKAAMRTFQQRAEVLLRPFQFEYLSRQCFWDTAR